MDSRRETHSRFREWLFLEPDGGLKPSEQSSLQRHLVGCGECRDERQEAAALQHILDESRVPPSDDFARRVMEALPTVGWQARLPRSWAAALVLMTLLGLGAGLLIGTGRQELMSAIPVATVVAVWEMFTSSALAGAGLIAASWKGLGIAFQEVVGKSLLTTIAFGLLVVCLDLLLIRYVLRRRAAGLSSNRASDRDSR